MTNILTTEITLPHTKLDSNIKAHVYDVLQHVMLNHCSKDYGYILDIHKINSIKSAVISQANSNIIFTVEYTAETLKPEIASIFEGEVCLVFASGIFIHVKNKMKILIPSTLLTDYVFNNTSLSFQKNNDTISKGQIIKTEIVGMKYTTRGFNCFGKLV